MRSPKYYVSSGRKNCLYTLRVNYLEAVSYNTAGGPQTSLVERDHYVKTLGKNFEESKAKAEAYLKEIGHDGKLQAGELTLSKRGGKEHLSFGKYDGCHIESIIRSDPEYIAWAWNNVKGKFNEYQKRLIEENLDTVLAEANKVYAERQEAYEKRVAEREAKAKEWKEKKARSKYIGEQGEKIEREVTLVMIHGFETHYGYTTIYKFEDAEDNVFVWFSTGYGLEHGAHYKDTKETFTLKGTVKEHSEYDGTKQTVLTRCKVTKHCEEVAGWLEEEKAA